MFSKLSWRSSFFYLFGFFFFLIYFYFPITKKPFFLENQEISKKLKTQSFSMKKLFVLLGFFPILFIFILSKDCFCILNIENYFLANSITALCCEIIKHFLGKHRPDFLERIKLEQNVFFIRNIVDEGRLSFPSGHAAHSFCSVSFISMLVLENTEINITKKQKMFFILNMFFVASFISITRVLEHFHHIEDVICGSFIGISFSLFVFIFFNGKMFFFDV